MPIIEMPRDPEILGIYTDKALAILQGKGWKYSGQESDNEIRRVRLELYNRDMEIASIADNLGKKK